MTEYNLAMTESPDGRVMMHKADCPDVRAAADRGEPVMTMFGCQSRPPDTLQCRWHHCMTHISHETAGKA